MPPRGATLPLLIGVAIVAWYNYPNKEEMTSSAALQPVQRYYIHLETFPTRNVILVRTYIMQNDQKVYLPMHDPQVSKVVDKYVSDVMETEGGVWTTTPAETFADGRTKALRLKRQQ